MHSSVEHDLMDTDRATGYCVGYVVLYVLATPSVLPLVLVVCYPVTSHPTLYVIVGVSTVGGVMCPVRYQHLSHLACSH